MFRCLSDIEENTTHIANIKAYLLTALYNAPNTISNYYGYLRWLNKYERMENEEAPIALILCAEKSDEVIELLELDKGDIRVPQYLTDMPPREELEEKLRLAIQRAKMQLEQRKE